jgi:hypothetical protein
MFWIFRCVPDLRIFENLDYYYVRIPTIKLSPVCGATAPYK